MKNKFIPNSFQIPNALIDELMCKISPNALKCYLIIARKTTGWQKEWDKISTTQLMTLSGIKKKDTVYKAMRELEKLCLIESEKTLGKLTEYRLVPKKGTSTNERDEPVPKKGTTTSPKKGDSTKDTNTKDNIQKRKDKKKIDFSNYPSINIEACEEWLSYKKYKTKAPITKTLNFLSKYPKETQQQIVNTSIMNGYKGLFPPKQQKVSNEINLSEYGIAL